MAHDDALWERYFASDFVPQSWFHFLQPHAPLGMKVYYSWPGCFDIIRNYGADVVVFGNSETFNGIQPDLFADLLNDSGLPGLSGRRIIVCGTSSMPMETVRAAAAEMLRENGPRIDLVIWGVSFWSFYARPAQEAILVDMHRDALKQYGPSAWKRLENHKAADLFRHVTWRDVLPFTYVDSRPTVEDDRLVPASFLDDQAALAAAASRMKPFFAPLAGSSKTDCDFTPAEAELDGALRVIRQLARRTLLYVPPTTPLTIRSAPQCLLEEAAQALLRRAEPDVHVLVDGWESYGLRYSHFLFPTRNAGYFAVNVNHTNALGAEQITRRIAAVVVDLEKGNTSVGKGASFVNAR